MRKNNHHVFVKGQAAEQGIKELIAVWRRDKPREYAAYIEQIKRESALRVTPTGMSRQRTVRERGSIPWDLFVVIEAKYPEVLKTSAGLDMVHRLVMGDFMPKNNAGGFYIIGTPEKK